MLGKIGATALVVFALSSPVFCQHIDAPDPSPPTIVAAFLLPTSSLILPGTWESFWRTEPILNEQGRFEGNHRIASADRFTVPAEVIFDLLETASECPVARVPDSCTMCIKWSSQDGDTWYTTGYRDREVLKDVNGAECGCVMRSTGPDANKAVSNERVVRAAYYTLLPDRSNFSGRTVAGCSEVRLFVNESKITLSCADPKHDGQHAILAAFNEEGDVYFWLVQR